MTGCLVDEKERRFCSGVKDWSSGGGDTTIHIQTHFETDLRFYEDMRRWSALGGLPEYASKVKSVDGSCKTLKKETDAEISSNAEKYACSWRERLLLQ